MKNETQSNICWSLSAHSCTSDSNYSGFAHYGIRHFVIYIELVRESLFLNSKKKEPKLTASCSRPFPTSMSAKSAAPNQALNRKNNTHIAVGSHALPARVNRVGRVCPMSLRMLWVSMPNSPDLNAIFTRARLRAPTPGEGGMKKQLRIVFGTRVSSALFVCLK